MVNWLTLLNSDCFSPKTEAPKHFVMATQQKILTAYDLQQK